MDPNVPSYSHSQRNPHMYLLSPKSYESSGEVPGPEARAATAGLQVSLQRPDGRRPLGFQLLRFGAATGQGPGRGLIPMPQKPT